MRHPPNHRYEPILLNTEGDRQSQMIVPGSPHDDLVGEEYYAGRSGDETDDIRTPEHHRGFLPAYIPYPQYFIKPLGIAMASFTMSFIALR